MSFLSFGRTCLDIHCLSFCHFESKHASGLWSALCKITVALRAIDKIFALANLFIDTCCLRMHPTFVFLSILELFSYQVTGHPRHGPFQGPFKSHPGPDSSVGKSVATTSGLILGHSAPSRPEVSEYLGIPFAKSSVGDLRLAAPQAFIGIGDINATVFVSIQGGNPLLSRYQTNGSIFAVRVSTLS